MTQRRDDSLIYVTHFAIFSRCKDCLS